MAQYHGEIHAAARSMTRTAADAEDLAQDVIVRALRFADQFVPGTNFGAWVRTILRNTAINRARHERLAPKTAATAAGEAEIEGAPARPESPERPDFRAVSIDRETLSAPLLAALEELPASYRDVLLLWAVGDYKYREIAQIVGCPIGTVMSRLHRARSVLRSQLADSVDSRRVMAA